MDFVVLDMEGDLAISLILGQPFLRDAKARINSNVILMVSICRCDLLILVVLSEYRELM